MARWSLVIALLGTSSLAEADRTARLEYRGSCAEPALRARVQSVLGRDPFASAASTSLRIVVSRTAEYAAELRIDEEGVSRRVISAASCDELYDALALAIALTLEAPPAEPVATPAAATDPEQPPQRLALRPVLDAPRVPLENVLRAGVSAAMAWDTAGNRAWLFGVVVADRRWSVALEGHLAAQETIDASSSMLVVDRLQANALACRRMGSLSACAVVSAGGIRGETARTSGDSPFLAVGPRIVFEQSLSDLVSLQLQVSAQAVATRTRFQIDEQVVWASSRWELWSGIALLARVP